MKIRLSVSAGSAAPTTFEHAGPVIRIGRDPDCELVLPAEPGTAVSRRHARIEFIRGGATLSDAGSSNGTLLNGRLVEQPAPLRVGDQIQMGFTGARLTVLELDLGTLPTPKPVRVPMTWWAAAAAVLVLVVAGVVALVGNRNAKLPGYAQAPPIDTPASQRAPQKTAPARPVPQPAPRKASSPPAPPPVPAEKSADGTPSQDVKEVGSYVALDHWVSVLLQRQGPSYPWTVLRPEARVSTAQTLISLPGYRSLLVLDSGLHVTLWGNLPEFSPFPPVLESVVMLHAPAAGTDLDFTLDRGRVVIANRKAPVAPAHVRLRFLGETWDVELPDDQSEVAIELWGLPQQSSGNSFGSTCPVSLTLVTKNRVLLKTARQQFDFAGRSRLTWLNEGTATPRRGTLPELPGWWTKAPDQKMPAVQKALRSLLDWRDQLGGANRSGDRRATSESATAVVSKIKKQVEDVKDPDNQDTGVLFLAALDEVEPLVDLLRDRQNPNVRGVTLFALQAWLGRGGEHAHDLAGIFERRGRTKDEAERVVRLLYFITPDALARRDTYEYLVAHLDDDDLLVRDLAFWQLDQLGVGGYLPREAREIEYDPTWQSEKRRPAVERWRKLLAGGKVPVLPRR
jgi:pSer/pThr/pTyr-binding forkhead associated (FHA) protein